MTFSLPKVRKRLWNHVQDNWLYMNMCQFNGHETGHFQKTVLKGHSMSRFFLWEIIAPFSITSIFITTYSFFHSHFFDRFLGTVSSRVSISFWTGNWSKPSKASQIDPWTSGLPSFHCHNWTVGYRVKVSKSKFSSSYRFQPFFHFIWSGLWVFGWRACSKNSLRSGLMPIWLYWHYF